MKKFEEELKRPSNAGIDPFSKRDVSFEKLSSKFTKGAQTLKEWKEYAFKAEDRIRELESQLEKQQPEIPEVPQFVADWIEYWKSSGRGVISIDRALTQGSNLGTFEKIHAWLDEYDEEGDEIIEDRNGVEPPNVTLFSRAWINGYTVAKEKRFYLKNKLTGLNLVEEKTFSLTGKHIGERFREFEMQYIPTDDQEARLYKNTFTQSQIDTMAAGSYEKIEVQE
ncbi:DUF1642 domain-containing protein [Lactococcus garvieae]|nr:DUF1642 domain-containing protein [Lactococcus garvieae]